jgi:hypothetical protein
MRPPEFRKTLEVYASLDFDAPLLYRVHAERAAAMIREGRAVRRCTGRTVRELCLVNHHRDARMERIPPLNGYRVRRAASSASTNVGRRPVAQMSLTPPAYRSHPVYEPEGFHVGFACEV